MLLLSTCTRCFRPAVVNAIGSFRNGRLAIDPRCANHRPGQEDIGKSLLLYASTGPLDDRDKVYVLSEIQPIAVPA